MIVIAQTNFNNSRKKSHANDSIFFFFIAHCRSTCPQIFVMSDSRQNIIPFKPMPDFCNKFIRRGFQCCIQGIVYRLMSIGYDQDFLLGSKQLLCYFSKQCCFTCPGRTLNAKNSGIRNRRSNFFSLFIDCFLFIHNRFFNRILRPFRWIKTYSLQKSIAGSPRHYFFQQINDIIQQTKADRNEVIVFVNNNIYRIRYLQRNIMQAVFNHHCFSYHIVRNDVNGIARPKFAVVLFYFKSQQFISSCFSVFNFNQLCLMN